MGAAGGPASNRPKLFIDKHLRGFADASRCGNRLREWAINRCVSELGVSAKIGVRFESQSAPRVVEEIAGRVRRAHSALDRYGQPL